MTLDSLPDLDTSGLCLVKTLSTALTCWPYRNTRHGSLRSDGDAGGRPPLSAAPRRGRLLNGPPWRRPPVQDLTDPRLHREHAPWRVPWKESQDTTRLYADIAFPAPENVGARAIAATVANARRAQKTRVRCTVTRYREKSGLRRAGAQGKKLGRPRVDHETERKVLKLLNDGVGIFAPFAGVEPTWQYLGRN